MKIVLTYASTLNGKITKGEDTDVTKWTSIEDQEMFNKTKSKAKLIIRTSKTYLASKEYNGPTSNRLVVVMTRDLSKFAGKEIKGQLEFTNEPPTELIKRLSSEGHNEALLAVGGNASAQFFKEGLIDEFYLTLEPKIFGKGVNMIGEIDFESNLELIESTKLNEKGTVLLHYKVLK